MRQSDGASGEAGPAAGSPEENAPPASGQPAPVRLAVPPDLVPEPVLWIGPDARLIGANRAAFDDLPLPAGLEPPLSFDALVASGAAGPPDRIGDYLQRCAAAAEPTAALLRLQTRTRGAAGFLCEGLGVPDGDRVVVCLRCRPTGPAPGAEPAADVEERRRTEARLQALVDEQRALLVELHHRVKNNLQFLVSLINLQAASIDDEREKAHYRELVNRIYAMGLISKQLYDAHNLARIDARQFVEDLCLALRASYDRPEVALRIEVEPVEIDVSRAVPIGLIVNELVSNALRHAFRGRAGGELWVHLYEAEGATVRLIVSDDGVGLDQPFPPQGTKGSFGLRLVCALVGQIGGDVSVRVDQGTAFLVTFPRNADGAPG